MLPQLATERHLLWIRVPGRHPEAGALHRLVEGTFRPPFRETALVVAQVGRYAKEPGPKAAALETGQCFVRGDEGLLSDVLGANAVAQNSGRGVVDLRLVALDDLVERAQVPVPATCHQLGVVDPHLDSGLGIRG